MLPVFRRFTIQDYPSSPDWLEQMFQNLNAFGETTVQTLNKNLTIGENVQGQKYTTVFTTPDDYITGGFQQITFAYTGGGQPNCCLVGSIKQNDGVRILIPVSVTDWFTNINTNPFRVTINYIAGLNPSTTYTAILLVL